MNTKKPSFLPEDSNENDVPCGYKWFKVDDPLFNDGCKTHDAQFEDNHNGTHYQPRLGMSDDPEMTLTESNRRLFANWYRKWKTLDGTKRKWIKMQGMVITVSLLSWAFWR